MRSPLVTTALLASIVALVAPTRAHAQPSVVALSGGWSLHRNIGAMSLQGVACGRDVAYARGWYGDLARWDGTTWQSIPRRRDSMYGRTLAVTPDGRVFLEASGHVSSWDGRAWADFELPAWQGDAGSALAAPSATAVYYVGRGRIARFDGTRFTTYSAGTWRELTAVAVVGQTVLVGGQGGTIQRHDGRAWTRETTGVGGWIRGITAFASDDVWAWGDDAVGRAPLILHFDGRTWTRRDSGLGGPVTGLGGTASRVYAVTTMGVMLWGPSGWLVDLPITALEGGHTLAGVCATNRHVIVGDFSGHALVHAR